MAKQVKECEHVQQRHIGVVVSWSSLTRVNGDAVFPVFMLWLVDVMASGWWWLVPPFLFQGLAVCHKSGEKLFCPTNGNFKHSRGLFQGTGQMTSNLLANPHNIFPFMNRVIIRVSQVPFWRSVWNIDFNDGKMVINGQDLEHNAVNADLPKKASGYVHALCLSTIFNFFIQVAELWYLGGANSSWGKWE